MDIVAVLLASLISIISPTGLVVERVAENLIRSQFQSVDQIQVRVDNAPVHQILAGKIDRVLISGKGLQLTQGFRIERLEIETDAIDIDPNSLNQGQLNLGKPIQAGVRLILTQEDINRALQSPDISDRLKNITVNLPNASPTRQRVQQFDFLDPRIEIKTGDRFKLSVDLQERGYPEKLKIVAYARVKVINGRRFQLLDPVLEIDGQPAPTEILTAITDGINQRFDLANLEQSGITARVLQFQLEPNNQLAIAVFVRVEPQGLALLSQIKGF